jgi:hypothetical protein
MEIHKKGNKTREKLKEKEIKDISIFFNNLLQQCPCYLSKGKEILSRILYVDRGPRWSTCSKAK